jgi:hypothetical protein
VGPPSAPLLPAVRPPDSPKPAAEFAANCPQLSRDHYRVGPALNPGFGDLGIE